MCVVAKGGTFQVVEPRDDHGDDGDDHKVIKCSTWKEEGEKQKWAQGKVYAIGSFFCLHSRYHSGCEWFRIDSRTIKRGALSVIVVVKCC